VPTLIYEGIIRTNYKVVHRSNGVFFAFIHPSAWKVDSRKSISSKLHSLRSQGPRIVLLDPPSMDRGYPQIVVVDRAMRAGLDGPRRIIEASTWAGEERSARGSRSWTSSASGWRSRGAASEGSAVPRASAWRLRPSTTTLMPTARVQRELRSIHLPRTRMNTAPSGSVYDLLYGPRFGSPLCGYTRDCASYV
jgi:hypothetical protein